MNKLPGIIVEVISEGQLSLVKIRLAEDYFCSIVVDTPETAPYLHTENNIWMIFKENEVAIAKDFSGHISMQNRFKSTVMSIEQGKLLAQINMRYNSYSLTSLITAQAALELGLVPGDAVIAMVKTNEIILAHD